jgi:hypothetical protein
VEVLATDPWQARLLLVASYRKRRLFLVGDAAHQSPPSKSPEFHADGLVFGYGYGPRSSDPAPDVST